MGIGVPGRFPHGTDERARRTAGSDMTGQFTVAPGQLNLAFAYRGY